MSLYGSHVVSLQADRLRLVVEIFVYIVYFMNTFRNGTGNSRKIHLKRIVVSVKFKSIQTHCEYFKHTRKVDDYENPQ